MTIWNGAGRRIFIQEVGTRDGLQAESAFVPSEDKIALVNSLSRAGLAKIEVTAFVTQGHSRFERRPNRNARHRACPGRHLQRAGAQCQGRRARD